MDIEGRLVQKMAVQTGTSARGEWAKQEFVIEYQEGNFPSKACFSVWGADKVKDLERYQVGDQIKVSFNVSSREFNGKWYTDLRAWRISAAGQDSGYGQPGQMPGGYGQAGYGAAPSQGMPMGGQPYGGGYNAGGQQGFGGNDAPAGFAPSYGGGAGAQAPAPGIQDMPGDDLPF